MQLELQYSNKVVAIYTGFQGPIQVNLFKYTDGSPDVVCIFNNDKKVVEFTLPLPTQMEST